MRIGSNRQKNNQDSYFSLHNNQTPEPQNQRGRAMERFEQIALFKAVKLT
jgi:hypothetical protein